MSTSTTSRLRRRTAMMALSAGVLGGGALGLVALAPSVAGASAPMQVDADTSDADADVAPADDPATDDAKDDCEGRGHGRRGPGGFGEQADEIAGVLGLDDADALRDALRDGQSLADLAAEAGVDTTEISTLIAEGIEDRIAEAVADGKLDQAEADERLADLDARVDDIINGVRPERGEGRGPGGRGGERGPGGEAPADADADATGASA